MATHNTRLCTNKMFSPQRHAQRPNECLKYSHAAMKAAWTDANIIINLLILNVYKVDKKLHEFKRDKSHKSSVFNENAACCLETMTIA